MRHGDLSRLGSTNLMQTTLIRKPNYSKIHKEFRDYLNEDSHEQFDIITIGSSCSNGGGGAYYQDYITDTYGLKVLNVPCVNLQQPQIFAALAVKGYIERVRPKYVILECVERYFPDIAGWKTDISEQMADKFLHEVRSYDADVMNDNANKGFIPLIMVRACVRLVLDRLYAMRHPDSISPQVMRAGLNEELFSGLKEPQTLYYYADDRNYLRGEFDIRNINESLNMVNKFAADNNVKFVFLGVPNKHSVYLPYIASDDMLPENNSFTRLEAAKKDYIFVNVKNILRELLSAERMKDLYWGDDTHWSYKAHKFVGDYLVNSLFPPK